jgi:alpha-glucosidase
MTQRVLIVAVVVVGSLSGLQRSLSAEAVAVLSPNEQVRFELKAEGGGLAFSLAREGRLVIESSPVRISVDGVELCDGVEIGSAEEYEIDEEYPWRGVHSVARNQCRGSKARLKHTASGTTFVIDVRVFDDGVGFRHVIHAAENGAKPRTPGEATTFIVPAKSRVWFHDLGGHYEATYDNELAEEVDEGQWIGPPMTFQLPGGAAYASITEAGLANYSGMALVADGKRGFKVGLGHEQPISYPFELRYEEDIERVQQPATVEGEITSPWRVVLVGADLNTLVNSDVIHNLCPPPDPALFPQGIETDWVKPGRAVWKYLDGGENSFEEMKEFSRMAGELGFEYHVIEGFWRRWSEEQMRELVDYSREQGVGVWFWRHSKELRTPEAREEFFSQLERVGVVGAKIDFLDHEHKEVIDHYAALLEAAARHKILVNFHGANKPTGEARTWPNELIREAVRGMEASRLKERAGHNATLPFTRFLAGHADYTPVVFGERRGDSTWAHQIATAAVFTEPLLTYGSHPQKLLDNPAVEMIKSIPAVWDETIALPTCKIGETAAFARRRGDVWHLAVLNGGAERTLTVPLDFLGGGAYDAMIVGDKAGNPAAVDVSEGRHSSADMLEVKLEAGGGFIARFEPGR